MHTLKRKIAEVPEGMYKIKELPRGTYIKRKKTSKKVYRKSEYVRGVNAYSVVDEEDMNREMFVRSNTLVYAGFTY